MTHKASDVARWFLAHNRRVLVDGDAEYISNLKLQKLLYYAQGSFLAVKDNPLFPDDIVAWRHGPVVESVYHQYSCYGANGIDFDEDFDANIFTDDENALLIQVYDIFGQYSAWKLRDMTHEEDPWRHTASNGVIATSLIKDYFRREYLDDGD